MIPASVVVDNVASRVPRMRGDDPRVIAVLDVLEGVPRMRGDDPIFLHRDVPPYACSPHARG